MIGPAISGLVIAGVGTGWAFLINGASFVQAVLALALAFLRAAEIASAMPRPTAPKVQLHRGIRYAWGRPDLKAILVMLFPRSGTFGMEFSIFISTMAVSVFHADALRLWPAAVDHAGRQRWPARC